MTTQVIRPSEARRAALRQAEGEMGAEVSNFFPIERYYSAADKVLQSFLNAYNEKRLDDAYVLGKRFATFSLEGLPKHDYYRSPRYAKLQKKNNENLEKVIARLEQVAKWMDEEEAEKQRLREEYRKRLEAERKRVEQERVRQQEAIEKARYKELQERVEQQRKKSQRGTANVQQSAMSKLQMLSQSSFPDVPLQQPGSTTQNGSLRNQLGDTDINDRHCKSTGSLLPNETAARPGPERAISTRTRRSRWQQEEGGIDAPGSHLGGEDPLPPPIPPPSVEDTPPPPSYNQVVAQHDKLVSSTKRTPNASSQLSVQRTVTAPAGGAIIRSGSDLISFPEPPDEVLPPPPPYCECIHVLHRVPFVSAVHCLTLRLLST